tara:strand:+ start:1288 stop:2145 length:858 start_codon:yes stop_codon:yes gene_type:complete
MGTYGLNTKVKVGGIWTDAKPHVKVSGTWKKVKIAYSKVGGSWQKTYEYEWVYTFSAGEHTDVDIDTLAGIDKYYNVRVVIPSNATLVASSTNAYALKTGSGYSGTLTIVNNGSILGRGGNGGGGGSGYSYNEVHGPSNGTAGGYAMYVESPFTLNNTGTLAGGGGGGSGGNGAVKVGTGYYAGGGGGGGRPYGLAGTSPRYTGGTFFYGSDGNAGTLLAHGGGGAGGSGAGGYAGGGGYGGIPGTAGGDSNQGGGSISFDSVDGYGGASGATYHNPSNFTITTI